MSEIRLTLSFGVLLAVLAIITVVGVGLFVTLHHETWIPALLAVVVAVGVGCVLLAPSAEETEATSSGPSPPAVGEAAPGAPVPAASSPATPGTPSEAVQTVPRPVAPPVPFDPVDEEPDYDPVQDADEHDAG